MTRRQEERAARLGGTGLATGYRVLRAEPAAKARRWAWAAGGLALAGFVAAAAVIIMAVGTAKPRPALASAAPEPAASSSPAPGQPATPGWQSLGTDDFSDASTGWLVQEDSSLKMGYVEGDYEIAVKRPQSSWDSLRALQDRFGALRVEVDAVLRSGSRTDDYVGVACFLGSTPASVSSAPADEGYYFIVWPDGGYAIARAPGGEGALVRLTGGVDSTAIKGFRETNRITGECIRKSSGAALLTLYVNGEQIDQASSEGGPDAFNTVRLTVYSDKGGTEARFDNFALAAR